MCINIHHLQNTWKYCILQKYFVPSPGAAEVPYHMKQGESNLTSSCFLLAFQGIFDRLNFKQPKDQIDHQKLDFESCVWTGTQQQNDNRYIPINRPIILINRPPNNRLQ